uniref:Uncharacterized protein n=1 Tax=Tanacetum cinerariifolium TaxID=118510 RepID=A0A6L2PCJ3_TANCI|nr:hypothetical protein [Tanacetum cinerariifolium]
MYHPYFDSPSPFLQPNQGYYPLNRINLDMDIKNLLGTQEYYAGQGSSGNQDYYMGQDYSMGHHSSAHGSSQGLGMSGPFDPVEDEFFVEEVTLVKAKKVTKRHKKAKTTDNLEASKPWITAKEIALCKA